jgi:hypothetical protein
MGIWDTTKRTYTLNCLCKFAVYWYLGGYGPIASSNPPIWSLAHNDHTFTRKSSYKRRVLNKPRTSYKRLGVGQLYKWTSGPVNVGIGIYRIMCCLFIYVTKVGKLAKICATLHGLINKRRISNKRRSPYKRRRSWSIVRTTPRIYGIAKLIQRVVQDGQLPTDCV